MQRPDIKPGIEEPSALECITKDRVLYKYFSRETFCKFLDEPRLKLIKPTEWDDKFEGHRHTFFQNAFRDEPRAECYRAMCWTLGIDGPNCYGDNTEKHEAAKQELDEFGHAAMWESYCRDGGVRIKSTYGKLEGLLVKGLPKWGIWAGKVRYEPEAYFKNGLLPGDIGLVGQLFIKGVTFRHEAEFRFLFLPDDQKSSDDEIYLPIDDPHEFIDEFLIAPQRAKKPWGAQDLCGDCINTFSSPLYGPTNIKNGVQHCRISQLYGNVSWESPHTYSTPPCGGYRSR